MPHSKRVYGWHPSNRESVHPRYQLPEHHQGVDALPASVDLEPQCPPVYDQGQLGSCTANALAALFQFLLIKLGKPSFIPSRLMIYWGEREIEGTIDEDAGADGDDGVTFLQTKGVCPETTWPYDPTKFTEEPPAIAWSEAVAHKLGNPSSIDNTDIVAIKSCLASGYPIAFGFVVYPAMESQRVATSGILNLPFFLQKPIGGHEVLMVGYDDARQQFKIRNSWGPDWGLAGYFWMPYPYATNPKLASDFCSATLAS